MSEFRIDRMIEMEDEAAQLRRRIEALEAALREIINEQDGCVSPGFKAKARAALDKDAGIGCGKSVVEPWGGKEP